MCEECFNKIIDDNDIVICGCQGGKMLQYDIQSKNILIIPIFLMKGRHIIMDISEGENSWKSILESEGLRVECLMNSLLQYNEIRKLYIEMLDFSDNLQRD